MTWSYAVAVKNARGDADTTYAGTGAKLQVWTTAYGTKLAEFSWTANVWAACSSGVKTANTPTTNPVLGLATGTAAIAKLTKSDGTTVVIQDLTCGTSGTDLILTNTSITISQNVQFQSLTVTEA